MRFIPEDILVFLLLYIVVYVSIKHAIKPVLDYLRGKPQKEGEAPDVMRAIYKQEKKAAVWGRRPTTKRILCEGDRDIPPIGYRLTGVLPGTTCAVIFWKPRCYLPGQWTIVPVRRIREYAGRRTMRIRCRGFRSLGEGLWMPIPTVYDVDEAPQDEADVWAHFVATVDNWCAAGQEHLRANGLSTASLTQHVELAKLRMQEKLPLVDSENEGGEV